MKKNEHQEQKALVQWFRLQWPAVQNCLFAIPNGGNRSITEAVRLKSEGVLPGVSDLFLMIPKGRFHGMFIEMKAKGGYASAPQKQFIALAQAMGYMAVVCHGFEDAQDQIKKYLAQS